jgi:hypothetical protein
MTQTNGGGAKKRRGRPPGGPTDPTKVSHHGVPIKMDPRALRLLNSLADWLNDYQYRIVMKVVAREVRRQGMVLPPHKQQDLESIEKDLGLDRKDSASVKTGEE